MSAPPERARIAALGYHEVTAQPFASGFPRPGALQFTVTPALFAAHLDAIARAGAQPSCLTPGAAAPVVTAAAPGTLGDHTTLLTFDDGGESALVTAELLERRGWHGHFFAVTARLGTRGFLAAAALRELHARGHVVGSHSHTHPDLFRDLSAPRMAEEWRVSADILAQLLGEPCEAGAVPGGHISPRTLQAAADAGLRHLFTCRPVLHPWRVEECWMYGRVLVKRGTTAARAGELATGRGWGRARVVRDVKDAARRAGAPFFRAYLRRTTREGTRPDAEAAAT